MSPSLPLGDQPSHADDVAAHRADDSYAWNAFAAFVIEVGSLVAVMVTRGGTGPSALATVGVVAGILLGLFARANRNGEHSTRPGRGWATAAIVLGGIALGLYVLASLALQGLSTGLEMLPGI